MSTFVQLVENDSANKYFIKNTSLVITDHPNYEYRGLMLDTARRYFSIESIKRIIDGMSLAKLSIFHLHLSDHDSFPQASESFPDINDYTAFSS